MLREIEQKSGVTAFLADRILVLRYQGQPSSQTAETLGVIARVAFADPAARLGVIVIIDSNTTPPDELTRTAIAKMMKMHERQVVALAQVAIGGGFRGAAVRAVCVGLNLLARTSYQTRVCAAVDEALAWLSSLRLVGVEERAELSQKFGGATWGHG